MEEIIQVLKCHYGLGCATLAPLAGGYIHQVFRAETDRGALVVKRYRGEAWGPAAVGPTLEAQAAAAAAGHPVPAAYRTVAGDWMAPAGDGWLTVMDVASGAPVGLVTPPLAAEMGRTLARLHRTLAALPTGSARPFVPDQEQVATQARQFLANAESVPEPDEMDRFAAEVARFRLAALEREPIDPAAYLDQVFQVVHGDYYPANLLVGGERVTAILDWDFAGPRWRGMEVARAAVEVALGPHGLDHQRANAFLTAYHQEAALTRGERRHMFRLWFDYLLHSLYPLPLRYQSGAVMPAGWADLARRRHTMLLLLDGHRHELEAWTAGLS